jgi:hypothetical protein
VNIPREHSISHSSLMSAPVLLRTLSTYSLGTRRIFSSSSVESNSAKESFRPLLLLQSFNGCVRVCVCVCWGVGGEVDGAGGVW